MYRFLHFSENFKTMHCWTKHGTSLSLCSMHHQYSVLWCRPHSARRTAHSQSSPSYCHWQSRTKQSWTRAIMIVLHDQWEDVFVKTLRKHFIWREFFWAALEYQNDVRCALALYFAGERLLLWIEGPQILISGTPWVWSLLLVNDSVLRKSQCFQERCFAWWKQLWNVLESVISRVWKEW